MTCVLTFWKVIFFVGGPIFFIGGGRGFNLDCYQFFIQGTQKRVENARKEVEDAKAKVVATEMTLFSKVRCIAERRTASCSVSEQGSRTSEQPTPQCPWISQPNLVAELQREREELRLKLGQRGAATPAEECPSQFCHLSTPASDLMLPTSSIGHQRWQWERSEPVGIDGDVDRRRISRHPIDCVRCNRGERVCCVLLAKGQVTAWVARRAIGRTCQNSHHLRCRVLRCIAVRR